MKRAVMVYFVIIVLTVYSLANYFLYSRGLQALPDAVPVRWAYTILFLILSLSYVVYQFLTHTHPSVASEWFGKIGSFWFAAMLYFLLILLVLDIARLINYWFPYYPGWIKDNYQQVKLWIFAGSSVVVIGVIIGGYINNLNPIVQKISIEVPRRSAPEKEITIAMASDIHLCTNMGPGKVDKLVELLNGANPDIIVLAGDILDENPLPVIKYKIGEPLKQLKAPLGVYAIAGNHEYIGGIKSAVEYIESLGIPVLKDSVINVNSLFLLAGRLDKDISRFSGDGRKSIEELLAGSDDSLPVILLDHQPFNLDETEAAGVDLQFSGHTHNGQLWPLNYVTEAIFELSAGYMKKGNSHIVVSSGYGLWGPPVRTTRRPEIVVVKMKMR